MSAPYATTLDFLYGLQRHGIKLGLDTIGALLERTGSPERAYPSLHIGGTNGKGSTAAMAAAMLQAAGHRVGLYTSPHLVDFRERIQVNGVAIAEDQVVTWTDRLRSAAGGSRSPTFFEFTTAMAFHHFAAEQVDVAVLEVGMGGRFDATNVVVPSVSAITNVALDHQQYLGHDLASIAFEKAGIIKQTVPVVLGDLDVEAARVIGSIAGERQAPRHALGEHFRYRHEGPGRFAFLGAPRGIEGLRCGLEGEHQLANAACAIEMVTLMARAGIDVPESAIRQGLSEVRWEGRLEIAETRPILLLDGAHNPAAARVVASYVGQFRRARPAARVIAIIGMMRDKDQTGFLQELVPVCDEFMVTEPSLPRAASVDELASSLKQAEAVTHRVPLPADALARARRLAAPEDLICVTGSLMLVGEVKALLRGCGLSPIRG